MPPLTLRPAARAEIAEAFEWYKQRQRGLGQDFLAAVRETLAGIEESPQRYARLRKDVHRALLRRFPYSILYLAQPDATVVLACFHARRDPRRWHDRR